MAKRGYRGKHPHSDAKVSSNPNSGKYSSKLATEYNKLNSNDKKYDYIRTHYFYPQSTCTFTFLDNLNPAADETIVITSTNGTTVTYTAKAAEDASANEFLLSDPSGSLVDCINNSAGHLGKIVAVASSASVSLTQVEPGPDGDTSITGTVTNITASNQADNSTSINGSFSF